MVRLLPMNEGEFQAYRQVAMAQGACEHVKAGTWTPGENLAARYPAAPSQSHHNCSCVSVKAEP
ncbi:MAG TPA: hypothetical protein VF026_02870 [Ktedonobacteraceae bacterium]